MDEEHHHRSVQKRKVEGGGTRERKERLCVTLTTRGRRQEMRRRRRKVKGKERVWKGVEVCSLEGDWFLATTVTEVTDVSNPEQIPVGGHTRELYCEAVTQEKRIRLNPMAQEDIAASQSGGTTKRHIAAAWKLKV